MQATSQRDAFGILMFRLGRCTRRRFLWLECWLRRCLIWLFGTEYQEASEEHPIQTGVAELVTLQGILLTEVLALLAYVYLQKEPSRPIVTVLYAVVSVLPLGGIFGVLRARQPNTRRVRYAYDRGTIMYARFSFWLHSALVMVVVILCYNNLLPGQEDRPHSLSVSRLYEHRLEQGISKHGIASGKFVIVAEIDVQLESLQSSGRLDSFPDPFTIRTKVIDEHAGSLRIVAVSAYEKEVGDKGMSTVSMLPSKSRTQKDLIWERLNRAKRATHTLQVFLYDVNAATESKAKERVRSLKEQKFLDVHAIIPKKN